MIRVNRNLSSNTYNIREVFQGLDEQVVLQNNYRDNTLLNSVLDNLNVKIVDYDGYMYVDDANTIVVSLDHLKNSDDNTLHLDIIHELVHIKQLLDGEDLYDERYSYVDRKTEIEAYKVTVEEAMRLGMNKEEILEYLKVEWISEEDLIRLANKLGVL